MYQQEWSPTPSPLGMKKKVSGNKCCLPCLQEGLVQLLSVTPTSSWRQVECLKMTLSSTLLMSWTSPPCSGALLKDSTSLYHYGDLTWPFVESTSTWWAGLQCILGNHQKITTPRCGEQSGVMSSRLQPHSTSSHKGACGRK